MLSPPFGSLRQIYNYIKETLSSGDEPSVFPFGEINVGDPIHKLLLNGYKVAIPTQNSPDFNPTLIDGEFPEDFHFGSLVALRKRFIAVATILQKYHLFNNQSVFPLLENFSIRKVNTFISNSLVIDKINIIENIIEDETLIYPPGCSSNTTTKTDPVPNGEACYGHTNLACSCETYDTCICNINTYGTCTFHLDNYCTAFDTVNKTKEIKNCFCYVESTDRVNLSCSTKSTNDNLVLCSCYVDGLCNGHTDYDYNIYKYMPGSSCSCQNVAFCDGHEATGLCNCETDLCNSHTLWNCVCENVNYCPIHVISGCSCQGVLYCPSYAPPGQCTCENVQWCNCQGDQSVSQCSSHYNPCNCNTYYTCSSDNSYCSCNTYYNGCTGYNYCSCNTYYTCSSNNSYCSCNTRYSCSTQGQPSCTCYNNCLCGSEYSSCSCYSNSACGSNYVTCSCQGNTGCGTDMSSCSCDTNTGCGSRYDNSCSCNVRIYTCSCNTNMTNCSCRTQTACSCNTQSTACSCYSETTNCSCNTESNCICNAETVVDCSCNVKTSTPCSTHDTTPCSCFIEEYCICNTQTTGEFQLCLTHSESCPCNNNIGCDCEGVLVCSTHSLNYKLNNSNPYPVVYCSSNIQICESKTSGDGLCSCQGVTASLPFTCECMSFICNCDFYHRAYNVKQVLFSHETTIPTIQGIKFYYCSTEAV